MNRLIANRFLVTLKHDPMHAHKAKYGSEKWKYKEIEQYLSRNCIDYWFEYPLITETGNVRLYDLYIPGLNLLIEFDGKYHRRTEAFSRDSEKERLAEVNGFILIRIQTPTNAIIDVSYIVDLFE